MVSFAQQKVIQTFLRNRGQVTAFWRFVPIAGFVSETGGDQEQRITPRWAKIEPETVRPTRPAYFLSSMLLKISATSVLVCI